MQKCFNTQKENLETRNEAVSDIFLSLSKHNCAFMEICQIRA